MIRKPLPINPVDWTDEEREHHRKEIEEARKFHSERAVYRKRVNGRTRADH